MADTKTTALTENTTPLSTDLLYIVDDPGGSAASQKITVATLFSTIGARYLISEQTPTGTTATFTSIPGTYKHLWIDWIARTDKAAVSAEGLNLAFNSDTTDANYYRTSFNASDTGSTVTEAEDRSMGSATAANAPANDAAIGHCEILYYASTTFNKCAMNFSIRRIAAATITINNVGLYWESANAITRIDIVSSTGGNFISGSTFRLYGVN